MMLGMRRRVMLDGVMMMLFGMQFMAVRLLGMVRLGLMIVFVMGLVGLTGMVSGSFQMMGGFFVMVMLGHLGSPGRFRELGGDIGNAR